MLRTRALSSVGVVAVGIVPAVIGGWGFTIVWAVLFWIGYHEFRRLMGLRASAPVSAGYVVILIAAITASSQPTNAALPMIAALAIGIPLILGVFMQGQGIVEHVSLASFGTLLFALPAFAGVSLRHLEFGDRADWIDRVAGVMPSATEHSGRGLGWFLVALLVTWLADTCAYLIGRQFGQFPLFPRVSPNKTVEGAAAGLLAAAFVTLVGVWMFGLDIAPVPALGIGLLLGSAGLIGDLTQSMIKRQRGTKDSGTLIPGHGGIYDRVDGLMFVMVVTWIIASRT